MSKKMLSIAFAGVMATLCPAADGLPHYEAVDVKPYTKLQMLNSDAMKVVKAQRVTEHLTMLKVLVDNGTEYREVDAFVDDTNATAIIGRGYNLSSGTKISLPIDMSQYVKTIDVSPYLDRAAFTVGSGKRHFAVFTDPQCPFCKKFEAVAGGIAKQATLHYFILPLPMHKDAKRIGAYIMSLPEKERYEALSRTMMQNDTAYLDYNASQADVEALNEQIDAANALGISGTPTVIEIGGGMTDWMALAASLGVQSPLDPQGLEFLKQQNAGIRAGSGTSELHLFIDVDSDVAKSLLSPESFKRLEERYALHFYPMPNDASAQSRIKTAGLYAEHNATRQLELLRDYASRPLDEAEIRSIQSQLEASNDFEGITRVMMTAPKIGILKTPVAARKSGEIVDIGAL